MQGGIYNAALFGASQREARGKLEQMGGIKRPGPSGILASSPELINAVGNAAAPAMPVRATGPATPITPAPVQQAQVALPQVAAPTAMTPAPQPTVPAPQQPVMMNEGGFLSNAKDAINAIPGRMAEAGMFRNADKPQTPGMMSRIAKDLTTFERREDAGPVDITKDPITRPITAFQGAMLNLGANMYEAMLGKHGSEEKAEKEALKARDNIYEAMDTEDESKVGDAVVKEAGLEPTDENKQEFARTVLGIDTDDIGAIDDAIFDTLTADVSLSGQKLQQAVLLGLQNYKQTAAARAEAAADAAGGFLDTERGKAAVEIYIEQIKNNVPPSEVEQMMNAEMGGNIGTKVRQSITGSVTGGQQSPESLLAEARRVIEQGADPTKVKERLQEMGVDPGRL